MGILWMVVGFVIGIAVTVWFLFGDRMRWDMMTHKTLDDDFSELDPLWTSICIGDAEVELYEEPGTRGGTFARMVINSAVAGQLALAQVDDYIYRPFADYPWRPPLFAEARLRVSAQQGPGTMGWWFWNNGMGLGAELPDMRPFKWLGFYRIPPDARLNYAGSGPGAPSRFRAAVMNGTWLGMASLMGVPLLPPLKTVEAPLDDLADWTQWHTFGIEWLTTRVRLFVDGEEVLSTKVRIRGPLSMVFWYDNNHPQVSRGDFRLDYGVITVPAWLDVDYVTLKPLEV